MGANGPRLTFWVVFQRSSEAIIAGLKEAVKTTI
jgi:hypothetical protein